MMGWQYGRLTKNQSNIDCIGGWVKMIV